MAMTPAMVTIDCSDPFYLCDWWRQQLGWNEVFRDGEVGVAVIRAAEGGLQISFAKVPDPTPGKNKMHIDFEVEDLAAATRRLVDAGAQEIRTVEFTGMSWVTLADPEGNQFCISEGS